MTVLLGSIRVYSAAANKSRAYRSVPRYGLGLFVALSVELHLGLSPFVAFYTFWFAVTEFSDFRVWRLAVVLRLWAVGDTYISELFPAGVRGTGFGIAVGGGRAVSIIAPLAVGAGISAFGPTISYLAFTGLWLLTVIGCVLGPETANTELEHASQF